MKKTTDTKLGCKPATPTARAPNPRRVIAGRLNRMKRGELTPEGRAKLRHAALLNEPWRFSTGPKTAEGKAVVARNGRVRQKGPTSVRTARAEARVVRDLIHAMRAARHPVG